jgi:hypothetical protein
VTAVDVDGDGDMDFVSYSEVSKLRKHLTHTAGAKYYRCSVASAS